MSDSPSPAAEPPTWVRNVSPADLVVYGIVVAALALAGALPGIWRALDHQLQVDLAFYGVVDDAVDPWGHPWILRPDAPPYSVGPDGVDAQGGGDDVAVGPPAELDNWRLALYDALPGVLCLLAVVLVCGWETTRQVRRQLLAPRGPVGVEVGRAAAWALPLSAVLAGSAWALERVEGAAALTQPLRAWLDETLLVPVPLAVAGSSYLASCLLILGLRLRLAPGPIANESNSGLEVGESDGR